jgi:hypothetical protein
MKKKQRDDVMGEDESSLPINDGELGRHPTCRELWLMCRKCLVAAPGVSQKRLISINYKLGVPTSPRHLSTSVLHVASNGANTKRWFWKWRLAYFGASKWEHGQESENTGTAVNFGIEQKASGGLHRTETRSWRQ